ncbi:MAG TPA: ABC transporter ATP-binding protein [Planctomycetales bacterium]|nr:ABC transporter ATP-binding protein [Planctomycetales bacterium]
MRLILRRGRQVWGLVPAGQKFSLITAALVMACTSACNTIMPLLLGYLVDGATAGLARNLGADALYRFAAWVLLILASVYVAREALNVLRRYLVENSCTRINRDVSVRLVSHMMKGDLETLHQDRVGALHGRMLRSVDGYVRFLRVGFLDLVPAFLTGIFALAAAVFKQPLLGLIMIGVVPTTVFLTIRQLMSQKGVRLQLMRTCEDIDGAVVEHMSVLEYVRAANTHAQEVRRLARTCERRRAKEIRHHFQMALYGAAKALNEGFFHIIVLGLAIYLAVNGRVSIGDVVIFSMLFLNVMAPLSEIHRILDEGHEASLRVGDLLEMLHQPVDRSFKVPERREPRLIAGAPVIVAENLMARYRTPDGKLQRGLEGLNLSIRHGETIGVAGRSGSGKSTWIKVLLRLTHPCGGSAYLGGSPLEGCTRDDVSRIIGYVGQQPFVFSGSIAENIAYGNDKASRDDIRRAAELAYIHDEIMMMPEGYDAMVTERGQNLSGGQRQRLAIARILLRQPPTLILDEATSALDNISERAVQRALGLTSADRTTILVAHRLSTLKDADRIVVFDEGRIVEVGTYDGLVQQGGVFTELVMSAEQGFAADGAAPSSTEVAVGAA